MPTINNLTYMKNDSYELNTIQNRQWISIFRQGWPDELNFVIEKALGRNHKGTMDKSLN